MRKEFFPFMLQKFTQKLPSLTDVNLYEVNLMMMQSRLLNLTSETRKKKKKNGLHDIHHIIQGGKTGAISRTSILAD